MPKFSSRTYRLLWDAHSMTGVVIGLALFVLFATGALLLFRGEIRKWEEPALRASPGEQASLDALTGPVLDSLGQGDKPPSYVYMGLPAGGNDNLYLYATGGTAGGSRDVWVNPESGEWVANPNDGAITQTLYYLHFFYQIGLWGLYLSGAVGLFALLAIVTGTAVHLERLVKDFFQFRPSEKLRVAWADAHKVLGTIGLPFQMMYAFTGAYFGLVGLIALPYASMLFGGDMNTFYQKAGYYAPTVQVDSVETASPPESSLEGVAARAEDAWPGFTPQTMIISNMGAPDSRIEVIGQTQGVVFGGTGSLVYHGATGEELQRSPPGEAGPLNQVVQSMEELHFAEFGGRALEILFFLLALASSAVILTGNFIWLEVRRAQDRAVNTILARLTAGVATGMAPATALMFLSAWWHPPSVGTDEWTDLVLFGSWGLCVVYALARSNIARTHRTLLAAGGLLALLVPVANGFATGDWPWVAWAAGRWAVVGVDVGAVLSGGALLGLAAELDVEETPPAEPGKSEENLSPTAGKTPEEVLLDAG